MLCCALRKNRAAVRYWLWLFTSLKFLVPFSLLVSFGNQFTWRTSSAIEQSQLIFKMDKISRPLALSAAAPLAIARPVPNSVSAILLGVWLCGFTLGFASWLRWWLRIRVAKSTATLLHLNLPIQAMSSPTRLEPGVFGIVKPVLLVPEGIMDRLTPPQLEAILSHELCHVRRRDNLTAAIHLVVETIFWFHPLVWWIRARLVEERERACDEEVLRKGSEPQVYAEGILKVCEFYLESPLVCLSGVGGSNLKKRIEKIMSNSIARKLDLGRKVLLAAVAGLAVTLPVIFGLVHAPRIHAQPQAAATGPVLVEFATVKPNRSSDDHVLALIQRGGKFTATGVTLKLLMMEAFGVRSFQISGPNWIGTERWNVEAKGEGVLGQLPMDQFRAMLRTVLENQFELKVHHEMQEMPVYALLVGDGGPKLNGAAPQATSSVVQSRRGALNFQKGSMAILATQLSVQLGRMVIDKTGLKDDYEVTLEWKPEPGQGGPEAYGFPPRPEPLPAAEMTGPSIFAALQEQLGLRLESQRGAVDVMVIDRVNKPVDN